MDTTKRMGQTVHRSLLGLHNFLILASSAILTGILSHFIHRLRQMRTYSYAVPPGGGGYPGSSGVPGSGGYTPGTTSGGTYGRPRVHSHLIFQEVIAVLTLFIYLFAFFLPALKSYRGYLLPLNLILSYLWLTSLIFSSQDYSGNRCHSGPPYFGHCRLKHTIQAFQILGFCMLLFNVITEAMMWAGHKVSGRSNSSDKGLGGVTHADGNGTRV